MAALKITARPRARTSLLGLLVLLTAATPSGAVSGRFDPSFSGVGYRPVNVPGAELIPSAALIQPDGKALIAAKLRGLGSDMFAVIRLDRSGALDSTFNDVNDAVDLPGVVAIRFDDAEVVGEPSIALSADGKIVVAGTRYLPHVPGTAPGGTGRIVVARLRIDGSPDPTFGQGGRSAPLPNTNVGVSSVTVDKQGRVVLAGGATVRQSDGDVAVVRLLSDGSVDSSFGRDGMARSDVKNRSHNEGGRALVLQPDGKILVLAQVTPSETPCFGVFRYNADGSPDSSFGRGPGLIDVGPGFATFDFQGHGDYPNAIALAPDGKVVVAGMSVRERGCFLCSGITENIAVARLTTDGALDTTFGSRGNGKVLWNLFGDDVDEWATNVAVQADGKVLLAGIIADLHRSGALDSTLLARLTSAGAADSSFGNKGVVRTTYSPKLVWDQRFGGLVVQNDKILTVSARNENGMVLERHVGAGDVVNLLNNPSLFVAQQIRDYGYREGSPDEIEFLVSRSTANGVFDFTLAVQRASELDERMGRIIRLYLSANGRPPAFAQLKRQLDQVRDGRKRMPQIENVVARGLSQLSHAEFVRTAMRNATGLEPTAAELAQRTNELATGAHTRGQVLGLIAESDAAARNLSNEVFMIRTTAAMLETVPSQSELIVGDGFLTSGAITRGDYIADILASSTYARRFF